MMILQAETELIAKTMEFIRSVFQGTICVELRSKLYGKPDFTFLNRKRKGEICRNLKMKWWVENQSIGIQEITEEDYFKKLG